MIDLPDLGVGDGVAHTGKVEVDDAGQGADGLVDVAGQGQVEDDERAAVSPVRAGALGGDGQGLADVFATPEQKRRMAEITAVMSLLEGHADVVMDEVGPAHIPSVATIRARFDERRKGAGTLDRFLRRLMGLEAKMRQYRDGAAFVRAVQDTVGIDGFNAVWTSPETLPTPLEITDPTTWVRRVHG